MSDYVAVEFRRYTIRDRWGLVLGLSPNGEGLLVDKVSTNDIIGRAGCVVMPGDVISNIESDDDSRKREIYTTACLRSARSDILDGIHQRMSEVLHIRLKIIPKQARSQERTSTVPSSSGVRSHDVIVLLSSDDDDDDDDSRPLNSPLSRLCRNTPTSSPTKAMTTSASRHAPSSSISTLKYKIVDLVSSSDDENGLPFDRSQSSTASRRAASASVDTASEVTSSSMGGYEPHTSALEKRPRELGHEMINSTNRKKTKLAFIIKTEFLPKAFGEADIGDEVVEVCDPNLESTVSFGVDMEEGKITDNGTSKRQKIDSCDEIEFIGGETQSLGSMPHQREACFEYKFVRSNSVVGISGQEFQRQMNLKCCSQCYCYVCDIKADECLDWTSHCNATCKLALWKEEKVEHQKPILKLLTTENKKRFLMFINRQPSQITAAQPLFYAFSRLNSQILRSHETESGTIEREHSILKAAFDAILRLPFGEERKQNLILFAGLLTHKHEKLLASTTNRSYSNLLQQESPKSDLGVFAAIMTSSYLNSNERKAIFAYLQASTNNDGNERQHRRVVYDLIEILSTVSDSLISVITETVESDMSQDSVSSDLITKMPQTKTRKMFCNILATYYGFDVLFKFIKLAKFSSGYLGDIILFCFENFEFIPVKHIKELRQLARVADLNIQYDSFNNIKRLPLKFILLGFLLESGFKFNQSNVPSIGEMFTNIHSFVVKLVKWTPSADSDMQFEYCSVFSSDVVSDQDYFDFIVNFTASVFSNIIKGLSKFYDHQKLHLNVFNNLSLFSKLDPSLAISLIVSIRFISTQFDAKYESGMKCACIFLLHQSLPQKTIPIIAVDVVRALPLFLLEEMSSIGRTPVDWVFEVVSNPGFICLPTACCIFKALTECQLESSEERYRGFLSFKYLWKCLSYFPHSKVKINSGLLQHLSSVLSQLRPKSEVATFMSGFEDTFFGPYLVVCQLSNLGEYMKLIDTTTLLKILKLKCLIFDSHTFNISQKKELWNVARLSIKVSMNDKFVRDNCKLPLSCLLDIWHLNSPSPEPCMIFPYCRLEHLGISGHLEEFRNLIFAISQNNASFVQKCFDDGYGAYFETFLDNTMLVHTMLMSTRSPSLLALIKTDLRNVEVFNVFIQKTLTKRILQEAKQESNPSYNSFVFNALILSIADDDQSKSLKSYCDSLLAVDDEKIIGFIVSFTKFCNTFTAVEKCLKVVLPLLYSEISEHSRRYDLNLPTSMFAILDQLYFHEFGQDFHSAKEKSIDYLILHMYYEPLKYIDAVFSCSEASTAVQSSIGYLKHSATWVNTAEKDPNKSFLCRLILTAVLMKASDIFSCLMSTFSCTPLDILIRNLSTTLMKPYVSINSKISLVQFLGYALSKLPIVTLPMREIVESSLELVTELKSRADWYPREEDFHMESEGELVTLPGINLSVLILTTAINPTKENYLKLKTQIVLKESLLEFRGLFTNVAGKPKTFATFLFEDKEFEVLSFVLCDHSEIEWALDFLLSVVNEDLITSNAISCSDLSINSVEINFLHTGNFLISIHPFLVKLFSLQSHISPTFDEKCLEFYNVLINSAKRNNLVMSYLDCLSITKFSSELVLSFTELIKEATERLNKQMSPGVYFYVEEVVIKILVSISHTTASVAMKSKLFEEILNIFVKSSDFNLSWECSITVAANILFSSLTNIFESREDGQLCSLLDLNDDVNVALQERTLETLKSQLQIIQSESDQFSKEVLKMFLTYFVRANISPLCNITREVVKKWQAFLAKYFQSDIEIHFLLTLDDFVANPNKQLLHNGLKSLTPADKNMVIDKILENFFGHFSSENTREMILILFSQHIETDHQRTQVNKAIDVLLKRFPGEVWDTMSSDSDGTLQKRMFASSVVEVELIRRLKIGFMTNFLSDEFVPKYASVFRRFCHENPSARLPLVGNLLIALCTEVLQTRMNKLVKEKFIELFKVMRGIFLNYNCAMHASWGNVATACSQILQSKIAVKNAVLALL